MSGEKEVRLRESEYHRLMNAARRVENEPSRAAALAAQLRQAQRRMEEQRAAADQRQQAFAGAIGNLSQELQASTRDFHQQLQAQRTEYTRGLEQLDQRLAGQRQEYLGLIAEQAAQVEQQFARIEQHRRDARQAAAPWLADARVILDYIDQHQRHTQFAPGQLDLLNGDWTLSRRNLDAGHEQAAIATGQALYAKAIKLQAEIEFRQLEWDTFFNEAITGARAQLATLEAQRSARWVIDTEQGSQELEAEIDYWSDGALSALQTRVEQAIATLEQQPPTLTLDDLKHQIATNQEALADLERIITGAKERLIASQLRVTIAQDLLDDLGRSGWALEDSVWEGETADGKGWKNSYHLRLKDLGGNEMITVIIPEDRPQGQIENRVQFAYYPKDNNDARFAAAQTARLNRTLVDLGLTREPLACVPGHERTIRGDEQRRDFERIRATAPPVSSRDKR